MSAAMVNAKMTVETPNGVTYVFPKVELVVTPNIKQGEIYGDPKYFYEKAPDRLTSMKIEGHAFPGKTDMFPNEKYVMTATMKEEEVATCKVPNLYPEDLDKLKQVMIGLDTMTANIPGIFSLEIRVLIDDVDQWAVVGYGDAGAPCVLRFESV